MQISHDIRLGILQYDIEDKILATFKLTMEVLPVILLSVFCFHSNQAELLPSTNNIDLQPGEVTTVTFSWNGSQGCRVLLHTKLAYIGAVSPAMLETNTSLAEWNVQVSGLQLGYTNIIAAVNQSHVLSFEEGLVKVTVLQFHWLKSLSQGCGWIYFFVWTFSFYPQILINLRRKSVVGLNFDFLAFNLLGYICYSIFNCCLFAIPSIQAEYFRRHSGATNPVQLNDVLFSVHGFIATSVMILQVFIYERGGQHLSRTAAMMVSTGYCTLTALVLAAIWGYIPWLDTILWVSFIKLIVTAIKYIPQALMNYRNKSTEGWSIECILCDMTGSCFSLLQMLLISYNCDDWVSIIGDPTKFFLGLFSIGFDVVFMVQHYILYRTSSDSKEKKEKKSFYRVLQESVLDKMLWISENADSTKI